MVWKSKVGIELHTKVLEILYWRDLITKNIDWKVRTELFTIVFGAY